MLSLTKRHGYTLIEMLVVIAIIGVLAGLIFPVAASAKKRAKQTQCMNNMYQIFTALKQFQLDEHRYPEFIAGPVQWRDTDGKYIYSGDPNSALPLNQTTGMVGGTNGGNGRAVSLYPEYINTLNTLKCPMQDLGGERKLYNIGPAPSVAADIVADPIFAIASVWPKPPFRGQGLAAPGVASSQNATGALSVYKYSSYDWQYPATQSPVVNPPGEAHYSPVWADWDGRMPLNPPALERQLRWRTPPEDTVVTWCSDHRSLDGVGNPAGGSNDIVLFLDGHVQLRPSTACVAWQNTWQAVAP